MKKRNASGLRRESTKATRMKESKKENPNEQVFNDRLCGSGYGIVGTRYDDVFGRECVSNA